MTDDLIKELETATEGSRELDAKLFWVHFPEYDKATTPLQNCLHYTTSLDDALSLFPEGMWWVLNSGIQSGRACCRMSDEIEAYAATPALALCAAILKAKAHD